MYVLRLYHIWGVNNMKFYKLVNNNWVITGEINDIPYRMQNTNFDELAYKMGYARVYSQRTHRLTMNFYYIKDCAKAKSRLAVNYTRRNHYLNAIGSNEVNYMYFSISQARFDALNNEELKQLYRLSRCEDCGCVDFCTDIIKVRRNHAYCHDCVNNHAKRCVVCGQWYMKSTSVTAYNLREYNNTVYVCNHCKPSFERNLHRCADCGQLTRDAVSIRGTWYCYGCSARHDVANLIAGYHDGVMPIVKQFAADETPADDIFTGGTEIETECNETAPKYVAYDVNEILNKEKQLCKFEHDGSLHNGVEIITQPFSLKWQYENAERMRKVFETLQQHNCDYKYGGRDTCGLHIHVNRSFFKDFDYENRLCYLFQRLRDKIRIFSQRTTFGYCNFAGGTTTWNNIYNQKLTYMQGHGAAINCSNRNTIEFRIFRGTTDYNTYMACVEFTHNLCKLVRDITDITKIETTTFNDVVNYCDTLYLKDFCTNLGLVRGDA